MDLDKKLKEYKQELEKTKVLLYNIAGAIQAIENLVKEENLNKKVKK
jgi:glutaredoxin 2